MKRNYVSGNSGYYAADPSPYMDGYLNHVTATMSPNDYPNFPNAHEVMCHDSKHHYQEPIHYVNHHNHLHPNFPNAHEVTHRENHHHQKPIHYVNHHKHQVPQEHKKVHFFEHAEVTEIDNGGKHIIHQDKTIDLEADGFIKQKHRNFDQMCKWDTFKV